MNYFSFENFLFTAGQIADCCIDELSYCYCLFAGDIVHSVNYLKDESVRDGLRSGTNLHVLNAFVRFER